MEIYMSNIIETKSGTLVDPKRIANGSASNIEKKGPFFIFSIRLDDDDIREYSFTDRNKAHHMRGILISHLEQRIRKNLKRSS